MVFIIFLKRISQIKVKEGLKRIMSLSQQLRILTETREGRMLGLEDQPLSQGASQLICHSEYSARIPVSLISFTFLGVVFPSFLFECKGSQSGDEG